MPVENYLCKNCGSAHKIGFPAYYCYQSNLTQSYVLKFDATVKLDNWSNYAQEVVLKAGTRLAYTGKEQPLSKGKDGWCYYSNGFVGFTTEYQQRVFMELGEALELLIENDLLERIA